MVSNFVKNREGWELYIVTDGVMVGIFFWSFTHHQKMHGPNYKLSDIYLCVTKNIKPPIYNIKAIKLAVSRGILKK
jgi:hypothetical protein